MTKQEEIRLARLPKGWERVITTDTATNRSLMVIHPDGHIDYMTAQPKESNAN